MPLLMMNECGSPWSKQVHGVLPSLAAETVIMVDHQGMHGPQWWEVFSWKQEQNLMSRKNSSIT